MCRLPAQVNRPGSRNGLSKLDLTVNCISCFLPSFSAWGGGKLRPYLVSVSGQWVILLGPPWFFGFFFSLSKFCPRSTPQTPTTAKTHATLAVLRAMIAVHRGSTSSADPQWRWGFSVPFPLLHVSKSACSACSGHQLLACTLPLSPFIDSRNRVSLVRHVPGPTRHILPNLDQAGFAIGPSK